MAKINKKKFREALKDSGGNITIVSKRLDVARSSVYNYIERHKLEKEVEEEKQKTIEEVKNRRRDLALEGDEKYSNTWHAIKSILTRSGDHIEKQQVEHSGDGLKIIIERADDANNKVETESETGDGPKSSK